MYTTPSIIFSYIRFAILKMKILVSAISTYKASLLTALFLLNGFISTLFAQQKVYTGSAAYSGPDPGTYKTKFLVTKKSDLFGTAHSYIENIGQYGEKADGFKWMGKILYGYEGNNMPVLFTPKGTIFLQRQKNLQSEEEREEFERDHEKKGNSKNNLPVKKICLEWLNANPHPEIIAEGIAAGYHVYGLLPGKARAFNKLIYKEIYPGIDAVYTFTDTEKLGYEFSLVIKPGADINVVQMRWTGDIQSIEKREDGSLEIKTAIDAITQSLPVCYYNETGINGGRVSSSYQINDNIISFHLPDGYNNRNTLVIDPFVSSTGSLTGSNIGKAKDIDFDYAGNVFVSGGGDINQNQLAKFNAAGVLQWTFSGTLAAPAWVFGSSYGGWVVDKGTGKVYLGQGLPSTSGFRVIRLDAAGVYDNYITTANNLFGENWKMIWSCNGGAPIILIAGGGGSSNNELAQLSPPAVNPGTSNLSGLSGGHNDISDIVIDPLSNEMYTIYSTSVSTPGSDNTLYKHPPPYTSASIAWQRLTGFFALKEPSNRPYLQSFDNSSNTLAVNSDYIFYWDGKNLMAMNKTTGATAGFPLTFFSHAVLMQGGIYADECNNVFVGFPNGLIKVFGFNGTVFDDVAAPDITIPGFSVNNVYDLAYNSADKLLYASGDGFAASFDLSAYCPDNVYNINISVDCPSTSATATLIPAPPAGSVITYSLYNGPTLLTSNTTGIFSSLNSGSTYTVKAVINQACSGVQANPVNFTLNNCTFVSAVVTNAVCGSNNGIITATPGFGTGPYQYSLDAINFQSSNVFTGLAPGSYTVTVKDALGNTNTANITIVNIVPAFTITPVITPATCASDNGSITVTVSGGTGPYQYSLDGVNFQAGNSFTGLAGGNYTVTIKDQNNCRPINPAVVAVLPPPSVTNTIMAATCSLNNGTITAAVSGGTSPFQYSIDGVNYQPSNIFTGVAPGSYTITIKDANNCIATAPADITATPLLTATAISATTNCTNNNGTITVTAANGTPPYVYSINGGTDQSSNVFNGLATGSYSIRIKDAANCIVILPAETVGLVNDITVSAGTGKEICEGSPITLAAAATNATAFSWSPATGLSNPAILQPVASPTITTLYTLTATAGPCTRSATVEVLVNPRPVADAGPDAIICHGKSFQLSGHGGIIYQWSPANYLNSTSIQNPIASNPTRTITYNLRVTDDKGCSSAQTDAVTITILPPAKLFAGNDTSIVTGQPLQLLVKDINNIGFNQYTWTPSAGLNNPFIKNPVALPDNTTRFLVQASTPEGCIGTDDIVVTVFKEADIFVPTGFTPNNDQLNDYAVAIPAGILTFRYFRIYNRWGHLVFSTTDYRKGWDGKINGEPQASATYAWMAEAVDYRGRVIRKKGLVTLIR